MLRVASVEGEQFTAEVIAQLQHIEARVLVRQLSGSLDQHHRLIKSQGTQRLGIQLISHFQFRHILFQKYLYNTIDEVERVYLHEAVGNMLEQLYGPRTDAIAGDLARHFNLASMDDKAVIYFQMAADKAVRSYALQEAIAYYNEAIELLQRLPTTAQHRQQEVALQVSLGNLLIAQRGFAAAEVERAFQRARDLCRYLDATLELILVLHGLFRYNLVHANFALADDLAEQIMFLTRDQPEAMMLCPAELSYGLSMVFRGEFAAGSNHLNQAIAAYDSGQHATYFQRFGQSPLTVSLSQQALALWYLGFADKALQKSREAVAVAQGLAHPFSLAAALVWAAWVHQLRREPELVQDYIKSLGELTSSLKFPYFEAMGAALGGWATIESGDAMRGCIEINQGFTSYQATGAKLQAPYQQSLLAEGYGKIGQTQEGLAVAAEALATAEGTGERHYDAETLRICGDLFNAQGDSIQAEQSYIKAIEIAKSQQARTLELRARVSLCRLWQGHERESDAYRDLAMLFSRFTEGFETLDLREAKELLENRANSLPM